jgi:hypothetical protein
MVTKMGPPLPENALRAFSGRGGPIFVTIFERVFEGIGPFVF